MYASASRTTSFALKVVCMWYEESTYHVDTLIKGIEV